MAPTVATRLRLAQLEEAICTAKEAVKKVVEAQQALEDQEAKRRRREWGDDGDEISDENNEVDESEEEEDNSSKTSADPKEQTLQGEVLIDTDEEELDYETKQERLEERKRMCMREEIDAYK